MPPVNRNGGLYSSLTPAPLSRPTRSPVPPSPNLPGWVFIRPSATCSSLMNIFRVPLATPFGSSFCFVNSTPSVT